MKRSLLRIFLISVFIPAAAIMAQAPSSWVIQQTSFGVPASPAFELLPGKVSDVVHLITPHDIQTDLLSLYDNGHLRTGAAFDIRPLAGIAKSLAAYQKDPVQQVAWRTVASIGTAPASDNPQDVLIALGARFPILDFGDPRADAAYISKIENTYTKYLHDHPLGAEASDDERNARAKEASDTCNAARMEFITNSWNAVKLDAGIGYVARAVDGSLTSPKLLSDRFGFWLAFAFPLADMGQISLSGKFSSWIRTDSMTQETNRSVFGAGVRLFPAEWFSATLEGSRTVANYGIDSLGEKWWHYAVVAEIKIPVLSGWIGLGYGADTDHRSFVSKGVSFHYSYYHDAQLKK